MAAKQCAFRCSPCSCQASNVASHADISNVAPPRRRRRGLRFYLETRLLWSGPSEFYASRHAALVDPPRQMAALDPGHLHNGPATGIITPKTDVEGCLLPPGSLILLMVRWTWRCHDAPNAYGDSDVSWMIVQLSPVLIVIRRPNVRRLRETGGSG